MLLRKEGLVVAVDGTRMSIFQNIGDAFDPELKLIEEYHNPSQRTSELGTDRPGRAFQSKSSRRATHEPTDFQQQEEDDFVIGAARKIEEMVSDSREGLVLVAAPRALGLLRKNLNPATSARLLAEIPKDFGADDAKPLARMLAKYQA
jgi:protein required for attachment to host cells